MADIENTPSANVPQFAFLIRSRYTARCSAAKKEMRNWKRLHPRCPPLPRCNILQCLAGDKVFEVYARSQRGEEKKKKRFGFK